MILLVHGGAGRKKRGPEDPYRAGLREALREEETEALDAVSLAIGSLERNEIFNAGRGSVLSADGRVRMDASLATSDGRSGAVGDTMLAHSAIGAARLVLEESPHTLLVGVGVDDWLGERGLTSAPAGRVTGYQKSMWLRWKDGARDDSLGTVGAVALDSDGNLAAGTSTGGLRGKREGRVGDSAVCGAGTWCSHECAISFTGDGDAILARSSAARVALRIEEGEGAIRAELDALEALGAAAGCIVLLQSGESWAMRNCQTMHWGRKDDSGIYVPSSAE